MCSDARRFIPDVAGPWRIIANPPFQHSAELLATWLLESAAVGFPQAMDLVIQQQTALKWVGNGALDQDPQFTAPARQPTLRQRLRRTDVTPAARVDLAVVHLARGTARGADRPASCCSVSASYWTRHFAVIIACAGTAWHRHSPHSQAPRQSPRLGPRRPPKSSSRRRHGCRPSFWPPSVIGLCLEGLSAPSSSPSLWLRLRRYASLAAGGLADFAGQNLGGSPAAIISAHRNALPVGRLAPASGPCSGCTLRFVLVDFRTRFALRARCSSVHSFEIREGGATPLAPRTGGVQNGEAMPIFACGGAVKKAPTTPVGGA